MTAPSQQKLKVHGPVVVTANRLSDGAVVYRGRQTDISLIRCQCRGLWRLV